MAIAPVLLTPADEYSTAQPFPHIVIDGYFDARRIAAVAQEVRASTATDLGTSYAQAGKRSSTEAFAPLTAMLIEELNSPNFLRWLEELTGIPSLVADPNLFGGGIHRIERGGYLKIHTDFNWHRGLQLHRRVNLLLYLNQDWQDEWGGHLELWHPDMSRCGARIAPLLNRMVIFSTTDESYHGHPEPLACPEGVTRNSIALYYYSTEPALSAFGRSELTNYQQRPGERFASLKHKLQQLRIKGVRAVTRL